MILFLIILAFKLSAQTDDPLDGHTWITLPGSYKMAFIWGAATMLEAYAASSLWRGEDIHAAMAKFEIKMSVADIVRLLEVYYEKPENLSCPISFAFLVVTGKLNEWYPKKIIWQDWEELP